MFKKHYLKQKAKNIFILENDKNTLKEVFIIFGKLADSKIIFHQSLEIPLKTTQLTAKGFVKTDTVRNI